MSLIIKGMDMPKGENIRLCWETRYATNITIHLEPIKQADIISIPTPHGRLIDADQITLECQWCSLDDAPTILEAED